MFRHFSKTVSSPLLAAIANLSGSGNKVVYLTGASTVALADITEAGRNLLAGATAGDQRTTLGLGTAAVKDTGTSAGNIPVLDSEGRLPAVNGSLLTNLPAAGGGLVAANNLSDLVSASSARTNLGLGTAALSATTDFQAASSVLSTLAAVSVTSAGTALLDDADAAAQRTTLGLGTAATQASTAFQAAGSYLTTANNLSDLANAVTARTNLGLGSAATAASTDFQAASSVLSTLAAVSVTSAGTALLDDADAAAQRTTLGLGSAATQASTAFQAAGSYLTTANNLSDLASASTARTNLGLGTAATQASTAFQAAGSYLTVSNNLSDLGSAATARTNLGLGSAATEASTAFQAADAELSAIAGLTSATDKGIYFTGSATAAVFDLSQSGRALSGVAWSAGTQVPKLTAAGTAGLLTVGTAANNLIQLDGSAKLPAVDGTALTGLAKTASNLSDLASASTSRTNLGLGSAATLASTAFEGNYAADSWDTTWQGSDGNGFWNSSWGTAPTANGTFQGKTAGYTTNANSNNGGLARIMTAMDATIAGVEVRLNTYFIGATSGTTSNGYVRFDINGNCILLGVGTSGALMWSGSGVTVQWNSAEPINQWVTWTIRVRSFQSTAAADGQIEVWAGEYFMGSCGVQQLTTTNYSSGRLVGIGRTGGSQQVGVSWAKYKLGINAAPPSWTYRGLGFAGSVAP